MPGPAGLEEDAGSQFAVNVVMPPGFVPYPVWLTTIDRASIESTDLSPRMDNAIASGRLVFKGWRPTRPILVEFEIRDVKSDRYPTEMRAFVHAGANEFTLDETETIITTYVLSHYVRSQMDPATVAAALLPAPLAAVRVAVSAALKREAKPADLEVSTIAAAVDGWRTRDPKLDAALDAVRRAATAAAVENMGGGRPATVAKLGAIDVQYWPAPAAVPKGADSLAIAPDGTLHLSVLSQRVVWRIRPDGILEPALGTGQAGGRSVAGVRATAAAIDAMGPIAFDPTGRLLALLRVDGRRQVVAREADGRLTTVLSYAADEANGPGDGRPLELAWGPDGKLRLLVELDRATHEGDAATAQPGRYVTWSWTLGADGKAGPPERGEPVTTRFPPVLAPGGRAEIAGGELGVRAPDGNWRLTPGAVPLADASGPWPPSAVGPGGELYVALGPGLWKIAGGQATRIAGTK